MATCGNPLLNECPLGGLRQGTCATPWFQHFLGFIFVLQCFHHMSMLFFVCVLVLFFGPAPGPAPYIYIYIWHFGCTCAKVCANFFSHAPFAFPMCFELSQCNHASVHASNLLFTEHFLDISFMFPAYFLCIVWSLPR